MGNPKAFITIARKEAGYRPVSERIYDFGEVEQTLNREDRKLQASRCMDCGIPFCHWACPLGNKMPEWQDLIYKGKWKEGVESLHETNNFPDFTGRICPAPCEKSCVLALHEAPVTIRENEAAVTEVAFTEGMIVAHPPKTRTGKKIAVIGSGPAGLAAAQQLNRKGHNVTIFEKDNSLGGLLRYGIPNFKLNKNIIDRRLNQLLEEGIEFKPNCEVGKDISGEEIMKGFDAVCIAIGAGHPRDIQPEGRDLKGIHFAMEFLSQQNQLIMGENVPADKIINAKNKHVLVIGGGDTGSDCVGTSIRQGAVKVTQIEILPQPPVGKNPDTPWPYYPTILKTSSSHMEGCTRKWSLNTKQFIGKNGKVLSSIQIYLKQSISSQTGMYINVILDVENYKEKQNYFLERDVKKIARQVTLTKVDVKLDPMNSFQRRIVHNALSKFDYIKTESIGTEPNRCVVIKYKEKNEE